ncbi:MAG TPA: S41 family peptidase [Rhizomicrobium sp.]|nr:S41 family peptidase [Rhizomicrobium sp.]
MRSLVFLLLLTGQAAAMCGPTGLYEGSAEVGPPRTEVTLNLYCEGAALRAEIFTDSGDFNVLSAVNQGAHIKLHIDTYAALADVDLTGHANTLSGTVEVAGEKGTITLTRKSDSPGADAMLPRLDLTPAQWRQDLDTLARVLPKRHVNAFFFLKKSEFEARVAALRTKIDGMNGDEVFVAFSQLVNAVGDGHTVIVSPKDRADLPLELALFGDDLRIVGAGAPYANLLGTKVIKIGDAPAQEARARAWTLTPSQELPQLRNGRVVAYLARGLTLHGLGIVPDRHHATYTGRDDSGREFTADVKALGPDEKVKLKSLYPAGMLSRQNPDDPFWCKPVGNALYCAWHSYQDLKAKVAAMDALIAEAHPQKLIIDMRDNGGGDNTVGNALLVKPLKAAPYFNVKGRLYVLIGPLTFSAAMNNAAQFQDETSAILVGETIGEKPNSFQEPRQFRLPNSHLVVRVSTLYYRFRKKGENAVRPDKEIIPSWADVKSGRDPVLDWVLAQPVP